MPKYCYTKESLTECLKNIADTISERAESIAAFTIENKTQCLAITASISIDEVPTINIVFDTLPVMPIKLPFREMEDG